MMKIFYIKGENKFLAEGLENSVWDVVVCDNSDEIEEKLKNSNPDMIVLEAEDFKSIHECQKIKPYLDKELIPIILVIQNKENEISYKSANAFVSIDSTKDLAFLFSTIQAMAKNRKNLITLTNNNSELQKSLYQLDSLYNTSFKLAGELDKNKLIGIMTEGIEKSLSYNLSYAFLLDENRESKLIVNSLQPLSPRLEKALKLRAILSYKGLFEYKKLPQEVDFEKLLVTKVIKHKHSEYDLNIFKFDNLFSPITIGERFFGIIEIFKENDFTSEDATCFQTLTKQVSIPLESALLYEEISNTNKKLERLERLKSEFISIVSHELRTPLTAIKNSLDILLSGRTGEMSNNAQNFLNNAKRNVIRLSTIINDLLDLSKIEAGKMELHFEKINIIPILEFMKNTFFSQAAEKKIDLSLNLELEDNNAFLYADSVKTEQILSNLISNAIKFTPESGSIKLGAKLCNGSEIANDVPPEEKYIVISVEDNGIGIKEEDQKKVFDEFQQIENSNTRKIGGTGLGLPIAKQLTETHKGKIWLQSKINEGTTFFVALPLWNDEVEFKLKSESALLKAQIHKTNVSFLKFRESFNTKFSLIDEIKKDISIVTKAVKVPFYEKRFADKRELTMILQGIDNYALDFILQKLYNLLLQNSQDTLSYDILYSRVNYPQNEADIRKVLSHLEENYKKFNLENL